MTKTRATNNFSIATINNHHFQFDAMLIFNCSTSVSKGMAIHRVPLPPPTHTTASFGTQETSL